MVQAQTAAEKAGPDPCRARDEARADRQRDRLALRGAPIRVRSSVKWTALTGVTPGTIGSSMKDPNTLDTVTAKACAALRPPRRHLNHRGADAHRRQRHQGARDALSTTRGADADTA